MVDEITLRQEIKEWRADNYEFGNKTPLERRAERILKEVLRNMERGTEEDLPGEEEQEEIIRNLSHTDYLYLYDHRIKMKVPHTKRGDKYYSLVTGKEYKKVTLS